MFIYRINFNNSMMCLLLRHVHCFFIVSGDNFQDANCGNTLLISLDELVKDGLLTKDELPKPV